MGEHDGQRQRRVTNFVVHLIFIVIICFLPEVLMRMSRDRMSLSMPWWIYAKSGIMIAVFYLNYCVIIRRTLERRHQWWRFAIWNILLITAAAMGMYWLSRIGISPHRHGKHIDPSHWHAMVASASFILRDAIMLILTVSLALALRLSYRWQELEQRHKQLIADRRETELASLRNQLNPHFLFNTLNNIYALIAISPEEAQRAVHELSQLLRYLVYENPERVELTKEIDFVTAYIELMKMRMGNRPVIVTVENNAPSGTMIPPLLFVSLVENAFKHGNTANESDPINISIKATATEVIFTTSNKCDSGARKDIGSGVGLSNLRRRLEMLYGENATLATSVQDNTFHATLRIVDK